VWKFSISISFEGEKEIALQSYQHSIDLILEFLNCWAAKIIAIPFL
jgi:hypothetical protein